MKKVNVTSTSSIDHQQGIHRGRFNPISFKGVLSVVLMLLSLNAACIGSTGSYHQAMKDNLLAMDKAANLVDKQAVANAFERIAYSEKDKWLPYYYAGMVYTMMSFETADTKTKDRYAEKANDLIKVARGIAPEESEIFVLQALTCYAMIQVDPMGRGMTYMNKANEALGKAEQLNADNPRIYFLRGQTLLNMPAEFGGGVEAALPVLKLAKEKYQLHSPVDDIHPDWGKEDVNKILDQLNAG
ncbi:MAG: hypothetical protein ACOCXS_00015 [Bacteroidota bacterium]